MADISAYQNSRQQITDDINQRIAAHQATVAATPPRSVALANTPLNLIAAGDSWFDYPIGGALPGQPTDVIAQLPSQFGNVPTILNLAHYGDATTTILGNNKERVLAAQLSDPANGQFDAILFSGGGDDMVGDQFRLWLHDARTAGMNPANALNQQAFADILGVVQSAYLDLFAIRDAKAPGIPVFSHSYDYAQPSGVSVCNGLVGPWLYPSLNSRGWMSDTSPAQIAIGAGIVRAALTQFDLLLTQLAQVPDNHFIKVATLGTVNLNEWNNELHPTPAGFVKIAAKFAAALRARFGGRAPPLPPPPPPLTPAQVQAAVSTEGGG